jgi:hypothetical protein
MLKSHKDTEVDNQECGVENWMRLISNPVTTLSDFVNAEKNATTMATTIVQEHSKKLSVSEKWKQ